MTDYIDHALNGWFAECEREEEAINKGYDNYDDYYQDLKDKADNDQYDREKDLEF